MKQVVIFVLLFFSLDIIAQDELPFHYTAEFGGLISTNKVNPFWIRSNQFGVLPDSGNTTFFIQNFQTKQDTSNKKLRFDMGAELVTIVGGQVKIFLPELYGRVEIGKTRLLLGRKKQFRGFGDSTLTSGSITWSGNATPLPEIEFSIPEYLDFFDKRLGIKGYFSHGWFGKQRFVEDYYLHSKAIYGRIGRPGAKIKFFGGIMHHAQWSGVPLYENNKDFGISLDGRFPGGLKTYKEIVFPFNNPDSTTSASFDYENRYGNHLGQVDLGVELISQKYKWLFYKQLPFETGQTFSSLGNLDDGLYGISISNKNPVSWMRQFTVEFLHTTNQGMYRSAFLRLIGFHGKHYGRDQNYYFSHAQYKDGWAYNSKTIGTPFMIPGSEIRNENIADKNGAFNNNNNIKAAYAALSYSILNVTMVTRASLSINYGSDMNVFNETANQLSFGHKMTVPLHSGNSFVNINVGIEQGDLIKDNFGIMFSYKKMWQ